MLSDFRTVGAVAPSSRHLAKAMLGPLPLKKARTVVEVGPGTGVMTRALLDLLPYEATLFAFEINPRFSRFLRTHVPDSRLIVIDASAEKIRRELELHGHTHVDAVVSSLALGLMPHWQRSAFLRAVCSLLDAHGVFTQYQYVHSLQMKNGQVRRFDLEQLLHRYFASVQRKMILRNLPPAFVFICKGPLMPESEDLPKTGRC